MNKTIYPIVAASFVIFFSPALPATANDETNFWIGILRNDGHLMPIAYYQNDSWSTPWPNIQNGRQLGNAINAVFGKSAASRRSVLPISRIPGGWLGESKKTPVNWYLYNSKNQLSTLTATGVKLHESHCTPMLSLVTNYSNKESEKVEVEYWPKPKAGFVASKPVKMIKMQRIDAKSAVASEIVNLLKPRFRKLENDEILKVEKKYESIFHKKYSGHGGTEKKRSQYDHILESIYRSSAPLSDKHLFYINLTKKYDGPKTDSDYKCKSISWFGAWVSMGDSERLIISQKLNLTNCDMKGVDTIKPNLVLPVGDKYYVVSENFGYESESYTIDLLSKNKLKKIIRVEGGGC